MRCTGPRDMLFEHIQKRQRLTAMSDSESDDCCMDMDASEHGSQRNSVYDMGDRRSSFLSINFSESSSSIKDLDVSAWQLDDQPDIAWNDVLFVNEAASNVARTRLIEPEFSTETVLSCDSPHMLAFNAFQARMKRFQNRKPTIGRPFDGG